MKSLLFARWHYYLIFKIKIEIFCYILIRLSGNDSIRLRLSKILAEPIIVAGLPTNHTKEDSMKRMLLTASALFLLMAGCAARENVSVDDQMMEHPAAMSEMGTGQGHDDAVVTKHFEDSLTKLTDNNLYSLELVIPDKHLKMGVNTVEFIVHHGSGGDVAQAELTVTPWMPSMGHGVMQKPVVTERGGGLYSVENIVLSMTGHWQLQVKVAKDDKVDTAVFDFPEVKAMGHEHAMLHAPPPKDLDYASKKMTVNNLYTVSYNSIGGPVRINRIHSWELKITDAGGKPVNDAKVTVVGDMPEHGHGLPTQPEVYSLGAEGLYRIDGMKFQMPGWWVVTVSITADSIHDAVSFNLKVL